MTANTSEFGPSISRTTTGVGGGGFAWDVVNLSPGTPSAGAVEINTVSLLESTYRDTFSSVNSNIVPGGDHYQITGDGTKDLILNLSGESLALPIPINIRNWQQVFVEAPELDLEVPSGGGIGQIFDSRPTTPNAFNANPILQNGGIAILISARSNVFCHGVKIEANGMECDMIDSRGIDGPYVTPANTTREFHIQNSRFEGSVGSQWFVHQDLFQQQGADNSGVGGDMTFLRWVKLENIFMQGGQAGMAIHQKCGSFGCHKLDFQARNYTCILTNEDYTDGRALEGSMGAFAGFGAHDSMAFDPDLENCYYWQPGGYPIFGQYVPAPGRFGDPSRYIVSDDHPNPNIGGSFIHPEVHWLTPGTNGDTATAKAAAEVQNHGASTANTGYSYVSPHPAL